MYYYRRGFSIPPLSRESIPLFPADERERLIALAMSRANLNYGRLRKELALDEKYAPSFPPPWPHFRQELEARLAPDPDAVYTADVVKERLPQKAVVQNKRPDDWKEMRDSDFLFSLYAGDLIRVSFQNPIKMNINEKPQKAGASGEPVLQRKHG